MPGNVPTANTVTITLPPGVTKEQYLAAHKRMEEQKERSAKVMRADWRAMTAVCKAHSTEYHSARVREWKAEGLDPSRIKVRK